LSHPGELLRRCWVTTAPVCDGSAEPLAQQQESEQMMNSERKYILRTRTVTQDEWICLAMEWAHEGGTVSEIPTYDSEGRTQRHIIDHGSRIHAIYTLSDVPPVHVPFIQESQSEEAV
jgi:hypothetical protein